MQKAFRPVWSLHAAYNGHEAMLQSPSALIMGYDKDGKWTSIGTPGPVVWMSAQLLDELHEGCPDFVELDCGIKRDPQDMRAPVGDIIKISGDDCRFVYVVRRLVHENPWVWEVSWPD